MKLYFARHGISEANVQRVISNRGYQHPLTEKGREQAQALAEVLRGVPITHLYSSPLQRAVETAQIVGASKGLGYQITDALREYDCGVLEGQSDAASWEQHERTWRDWLERGLLDSCPEGGESFYDIRARFVPFIESLIAQHTATDAHILYIGHGGTYRAMLPLVLDNVDNAFAVANTMSNASYVLAEWQGERLICTEWCGVPIV
jgi:broad specificity phosphatase PhoE